MSLAPAHRLDVALGERSYPIHIGPGLTARGDLIREHLAGRQVMIVTNTVVAPLYLEALKASLGDGLDIREVILEDGEQTKHMASIGLIWDALLEAGFNRRCTLIALGGGVIGDMTGFAAACYQRGAAFIQVPTTLLSQVDSSVGGKTGVNHPRGKNMLGAFWQPRLVLIDTSSLRTLPQRELSAGMAEVIKYGLLWDESFLSWLEDNMQALMALDETLLGEAIRRSCAIKADVVAQDETEQGVRALLNLGHTFGHAIETDQGYGVWLHGEAVGTGMLMAAELSARMGWLSSADVERIAKVIGKAGLPLQAPEDMGVEDFLRHMRLDKKNVDGRLRLILLERIGRAVITEEAPAGLLADMLEHWPRSSH